MKLATWKDGSRDGQLVVVSRDLATAHYAHGRATTLQQVLDDWNFLSQQLQELSLTLDEGKARHAFAFDPRQCMAPLPRAYLWACADGTADGDRGDEAPPLLPADELLGPCEPVRAEAGGLLQAVPALAAITGDIDRSASAETALDAVRLLALACVWRKATQPADAAGLGNAPQAPGPVQATSFAPVVVTPDELGTAWAGGRFQGELRLGGCRAWGAESENRPQRGQFLPDLQAHSPAMGQKDGEKWTAAADLQPAIPKSDSLLDGAPAPRQAAEAGAVTGLAEALARSCRQRRLRAGALVGTRCGSTLALPPGRTLHALWRLPDGREPFGALSQAVEAWEAHSQRTRFG